MMVSVIISSIVRVVYMVLLPLQGSFGVVP